MRFEVPQFIEIEDKIFGPFTWKQFVYLTGGAGATFMFFVTLPFPIFIAVATPTLTLAMCLAFYKLNNQPFAVILEAVFNYVTRSRLYLWRRNMETPTVSSVSDMPQQTYLPPSQSGIASLSRQLEINKLKR